MRYSSYDTPEIQPAEARLILALVLSLALHLALIFLVQVRPTARPEFRVKVLQVDLTGRSVAGKRQEMPATAPAQKPEHPVALEPVQPTPAPQPKTLPAPPAAAPTSPAPAIVPPRSPLPAVDIPLAEDPTYYSAKQVDVHPAPAEPIRPEFPETAAQAGIEGFVTLRLLIDDSGVVREISVIEAQPPNTFEAAALSAFRNARFAPALRNGRPVKSDVRIKVTFELVKDSS